MFFLLVATANAVIVSVLMSLAAAGGFLAIFFACLVAVYIGAVSAAIFAISATVISAVVGVMIATGKLSLFPCKNLYFLRHAIQCLVVILRQNKRERNRRMYPSLNF
jgi:hypothetical protein